MANNFICPCLSTKGKLLCSTGHLYDIQYYLYKCYSCGLITPHPYPTPEQLYKHYCNYGNYVANCEKYCKETRYKRICSRILKRFNPQNKLRLVDVGCSTGGFINTISKKTNWDIYGVEYDPVAAEIASKMSGAKKIETGDIFGASFEESFFDIVTSIQTIEHSTRPYETLKEFYRILKPSGALFLYTPHFHGLSFHILKSYWKEVHPIDHISMFTTGCIKKALSDIGFRSVVVRTGGLSLVKRPEFKSLMPFPILINNVFGEIFGLFSLGDSIRVIAFK